MTDCIICDHPEDQHGRECDMGFGADSHREVCLCCPGFEDPGYPRGKAWHRYKPAPEPALPDCNGCTDPKSEGTHSFGTRQHRGQDVLPVGVATPALPPGFGEDDVSLHLKAAESLFASEAEWENARLRAALELCKAHLQELEEAWRKGVISECDGQGGTRSNRNVEACRAVERALRGTT